MFKETESSRDNANSFNTFNVSKFIKEESVLFKNSVLPELNKKSTAIIERDNPVNKKFSWD